MYRNEIAPISWRFGGGHTGCKVVNKDTDPPKHPHSLRLRPHTAQHVCNCLRTLCPSTRTATRNPAAEKFKCSHHTVRQRIVIIAHPNTHRLYVCCVHLMYTFNGRRCFAIGKARKHADRYVPCIIMHYVK